MISLIIPTLNESGAIESTLDAVAQLRGQLEVIIVDGGSSDGTAEIASTRSARVITSERGRGAQMHAGARAAHGDVFWFLHADVVPPVEATERITEALREQGVVGGNFAIRFDSGRPAARFLTWLYPHLRKLGLFYGDSAIFVRRDAYEQSGGFQSFPLFEDIDLVRRLRHRGRWVHLPIVVEASARRFEGRSFALTFLRWAVFQGLYWLGVHPRWFDRHYAPIRGGRSEINWLLAARRTVIWIAQLRKSDRKATDGEQ